MNFKINDREWAIVEKTQEELREIFSNYKYDGEPQQGKYFGLTYFDRQIIYLDKDLYYGQKKQTLYHELMHCYIGSFITSGNKVYNEEDLCDISANSHDIIHNIVEAYFNNMCFKTPQENN